MINLRYNSIDIVEKSDHNLVAELKSGDEGAFRKLVDTYQDMVFNTCVGFVKNPDDADDLTQDVFIEIYHSINKFREDSKLSTWIYRITVNKALEHLRKIKRKKRSGFLYWLNHLDTDSKPEIPDYSHPGVLLENKEKAGILFQAVEKLPEKQRIAFTLNKLEGLSYEQISEVMKKSLSSVESLMHRAKLNLQKELFDYYNS